MKLLYKNNFWGYFRFYYRIVGNRMIVFLFLSIMISLLDGIGLTMFIPLLQAVNNGATGNHSKSLGELHYVTDAIERAGFQLNITTVLMTLILMFLFKGLLKYVQLTYYARLRHMFIRKVRYELVNNLQGLSYSGFLKLDSGRIQNTLTVEVARLFQTMTYYFNAAQASVMLLTYMILAVLANYQFALLVAIGAGLSNFLYRRIYVKTKKASVEISKKGSDFNGFLVQAVHYFKYLKSTNTFAGYSNKLKKVIDETEMISRRIGYLNAVATSIKEPIIISIVCSVILFQLNVMDASLNSIILSLLLFYRALSFLVMIQNHWQGFIENIGGMNSVATMTDEMSMLKENSGTQQFNGIYDKIELSNVSFYYDKVQVLDGIDINIPAKQTIALVGESGSGKTTIANMLAGLIQPAYGDLNIDGRPMSELNLNHYRDSIGYISQESVIFNDTIFNNITFWAEPTAENVERFNRIVDMASLTAFVASQPDKEHTKLGDNGILISGGQKQRISIARELFKKAEILIFDEATSALDSETEKVIQENIERLHGTYTMVIIAHRLSTIREADIIYLLEKGKVSASGSFENMVQESSRFKKMVSLQAFS